MGLEHTVSFKDDQYVLSLFIETPCQLLGPGTPRLWGPASKYNLRDVDIDSLIHSSLCLLLLSGRQGHRGPSSLPLSPLGQKDLSRTDKRQWRSRFPSPELVNVGQQEACLEETGLESAGEATREGSAWFSQPVVGVALGRVFMLCA